MKRFALVALSMVIVSCKDSTVNPLLEQVPDVIMPLKVGNWWYYYYTVFDSAGRINSTFFDTVRVYSKEDIAGEEWFSARPMEFSLQIEDSTGTVIWWPISAFTNRSDGLWKKPELLSDPKSLFAKYPSSANVAFDSASVVITSDTLKTVPAGSFKCYGYRHNNPAFLGGFKRLFFEQYFAPKVGPIYSEFYYITQSGKAFLGIKVELLAYNVK